MLTLPNGVVQLSLIIGNLGILLDGQLIMTDQIAALGPVFGHVSSVWWENSRLQKQRNAGKCRFTFTVTACLLVSVIGYCT